MDVTTAPALLDLRGPFLHAFLHVVRPCWITVSLFLSHITRTHTHKMHHISASTRVDKASLWADGRSDQVDWGGTKFPVQTKTARVRQHPSCLSENAFTYDLCICVYVYCIFYMLVCVCVCSLLYHRTHCRPAVCPSLYCSTHPLFPEQVVWLLHAVFF